MCLGASVFRHNVRDHDDEGRRIPCPRFGCITCGEHMALEPVLFEKYLAASERIITEAFAQDYLRRRILVHQPQNDDDHREGSRLGSCGRPLPGIEIKVVDEDGNDLPAGEAGEVYARGGNFMQGYLKLPEETAKAFRDGWYASGDVGYIDEKGYLFLVDRAKDMIISGGENIYPAEVESVLLECPAIAQACVVGRPDTRWGETVVAAVVLKPGYRLTEAEALALFEGNIAHYKWPREICFVDRLPQSALGKIQRDAVRQALEASAGGQR